MFLLPCKLVNSYFKLILKLFYSYKNYKNISLNLVKNTKFFFAKVKLLVRSNCLKKKVLKH